MSGDFQDAYLESAVLTATPMELIRIMYRSAVDALRTAQEHLAAGRISERNREISRALAILYHLGEALDHSQGGGVSRSLAELYDYMQRRLLEANLQQKAGPLIEVQGLLETVLEGWQQVHSAPKTDGVRNRAGIPSGYPESLAGSLIPPSATEYSAQSWSF